VLSCDVQDVPFDEVITLLAEPVSETATKRLSEEDQQTLFQAFAAAAVCRVHDVPFDEVITRFVPEFATATKILPFQQTETQVLSAAGVLVVHANPSGEVITLFVPKFATATKRLSEEDQQTESQLLSADEVPIVQVIPSGEVITLLPVPVLDVATKILPFQQTANQLLFAAEVL
jgi:hypothetical protein